MRRKGFLGTVLVCAALAACGASPKPAPEVGGEKPGEHTGPWTMKELAETAIRLHGLGDHHRAVTTRSADAQAYFDQGLRLIYAFNHDEATRSFAKAAALDPTCAMCFWGAALSLGPNYNVPMLEGRSVMAWDALLRARSLSPLVTPVERALIGALAKRYEGPRYLAPAAQQPYTEAYATAMDDVARDFPDDVDVQVLAAEAWMDVSPWDLWSLDGSPGPYTPRIVSLLEGALRKAPAHVGANHYYIHAVEASSHPEAAIASADRLAGLAPGAGHIVHMPAHIYQRVGRYADASEHNRNAVLADIAYMGQIKPWGYYSMYLGHNFGFLAFSSSMEGRSEESLAAARASARALPPSMVQMMPGMDFLMAAPIFVMVRFGKHEEMLREPRPEPRYPVLTALWLHGHGMARAAKGQIAGAELDLAELRSLAAGIDPAMRAGNSPATEVMGVAARVLEARIADTADPARALDLWADAVAAADRLAYAEPADWFYPVRHYQGAALLAAGQFADAEVVYREDLARNPRNGWGLFGLERALAGQHRDAEAAAVKAQFKAAWARADIPLTTTAF